MSKKFRPNQNKGNPEHKGNQKQTSDSNSGVYLVNTGTYSLFFSKNASVYVQLGDNSYIYKPIDTVHVGDKLIINKVGLVTKEGFKVNMENIDQILLENKREFSDYKNKLVKQLPDGSFGSRFGLALKDCFKSYFGVGELNAAQLVQAAEHIQLALAQKDIHVGTDHIKNNWLGAKTIFPHQGVNVVQALSEAGETNLNQKNLNQNNPFQLAGQSFSYFQDTSYIDSYDIYMIKRRAIANSIINELKCDAKPKIEKEQKITPLTSEDEHAAKKRIHIAEEIELLKKFFVKSISPVLAETPVMSIQSVKQGKISTGAGTSPKTGLTRQIVPYSEVNTEMLESAGLHVKGLDQIVQEINVLEPIMMKVLYDEFSRWVRTEGHRTKSQGWWFMAPPITELHGIMRYRLGYETSLVKRKNRIARELERLGVKVPAEVDLANLFNPDSVYMATAHPKSYWAMDEMVCSAVRNMANNELDRRYGVPPGTVLKLFDTAYQLDNAVPQDYLLFNVLINLVRVKEEMNTYLAKPYSYTAENREIERLQHAHAKVLKASNSVVTSFSAMKHFLMIDHQYEKEVCAVLDGRYSAVAFEKMVRKKTAMLDTLDYLDENLAIAVLERAGLGELAPLYLRANMKYPAEWSGNAPAHTV